MEKSELLNMVEMEESSMVKVLSSGEILVKALDGKAYIKYAESTFKAGIDVKFKNWGTGFGGYPTEETFLDVREITGDGSFLQIFRSISEKLDELVMTQHQIISFCRNNPRWLKQHIFNTFFLTKTGIRDYYVVDMCVERNGLYVKLRDSLSVSVHRLDYESVWYGMYPRHVITPKKII